MSLLYPYQRAGADWLRTRRSAYLGDEPGLGKTRTLIAAALRACPTEDIAVIAPAITLSHWRREWELMGARTPLRIASYQHLVMSEALRSNLQTLRPELVILDEAHFVANPRSKRTRYTIGRDGIVRGRRVWFASGTPMPRNPIDLYPVLASTWPHLLTSLGIRTLRQYTDHFCVWRETSYGPRVFGVKHGDDLRAILAHVMLRRTLADVAIELPELRWETVLVDPTPETRSELNGMWVPHDLTGAIDLGGPLPDEPHLAELRRAIGVLKAPYAAEYIANEMQDGHKVVVFAYHLDVLDILEEALRPEGVARVDGGTTLELRDTRISRFQNDPGCRVFLGQINACATGITLTAAHKVVIVEPAWGAHVNLQAGKRIHRIGQREGCSVRFLSLAGTIDEAVMGVHAREVRMLAEVTP